MKYFLNFILSLFIAFLFSACHKSNEDKKTLANPVIDDKEEKYVPISKSEDNMTIDTEFPPAPVSE